MNRTVKEALADDNWIKDLAHDCTEHLIHDVLALHRRLHGIADDLHAGTPDSIRWILERTGEYFARSAYMLQFRA